MSGDGQTIKVSEENWRKLNKRKQPGDTFDDVVGRLVDEHEEELAAQ